MSMSSFSRKSGVLLHPTSLPGKQGIGTFGQEARAFLDFLAEAGQSLWQLCPLGPTGYGDSPYQCFSAFAGNPLLIDLTQLVKKGWIKPDDLNPLEALPEEHVDFGALIPIKQKILQKAFAAFTKLTQGSSTSGRRLRAQLERFRSENRGWLADYCLFMALKEANGGKSWDHWPAEVRARKPEALEAARKKYAGQIAYQEFIQLIFKEQWIELKAYAHQRGIKIVGDMPIFVAYDSADVWSKPHYFQLDDKGLPTAVAGVPPDYFSATGQLWGNPLYNWEVMKADGFVWWIEAIRGKFDLYDYLRIDHFRGFAAYWAVPFGEPTAVNGTWTPAPGKELFTAVRDALGKAPIIAEDLGVITPDVEDLLRHCGFPGMKVLQFAFDSSEENDHIPHNYARNQVVYTGTHDNDTCLGWYRSAKSSDQAYARAYLKTRGESGLQWDFIQAAMASVPNFAIIPMQDILGLGSESRMNRPGVLGGNWSWRYKLSQLKGEYAKKLHELTVLYARA